MNRTELVGRLTRDPETRYTPGEEQTAVTRYTIAVNRRYRSNGEQSADFVNIVAFGKAGEYAGKYFRKGMRVAVSGRLRSGKYTNREGKTVYTMDVIAEEQEFADGREGGSREMPGHTGDDFMNIPDGVGDEGLPFD